MPIPLTHFAQIIRHGLTDTGYISYEDFKKGVRNYLRMKIEQAQSQNKDANDYLRAINEANDGLLYPRR